jgi:hypothetical protein
LIGYTDGKKYQPYNFIKGGCCLKNRRAITLIVIIVIAIFIGLIIWGMLVLDSKHHDEINKVISMHDGKVLQIKKVSKANSPFYESGSGNVIYKIEYESKGKLFLAWYRATKTVNDIHNAGPKDFPEKWIFEDLPIQ